MMATEKSDLFSLIEGMKNVNESTSIIRSSNLNFIKIANKEAISSQYESLDYDICENTLFTETQKNLTFSDIIRINIMRWLIFGSIGVITAMAAFALSASIEYFSHLKFGLVKDLVSEYAEINRLEIAFLMWLLLDAALVLVAALLVFFVIPYQIEGGIMGVKCYLNGIDMPHIFTYKSLLIGMIETALPIIAGLPFGMEGPMVVIGSNIAHLISRSHYKPFDNMFKYFRVDHETRNFISAGAAAGVAAAFGTPIAGVLLSLEEGVSYWDHILILRIFFCAMVAVFFTNTIAVTYHNLPFAFSKSTLLNFGKIDQFRWRVFELLICLVMGVIFGCLGALFNCIHAKISVFRKRYVHVNKWMQILEILIISLVCTTCACLQLMSSEDCRPLYKLKEAEAEADLHVIQYGCPEGQYNSISLLLFQSPETVFRCFFYESDIMSWQTAFFYFVRFYLLASWAYGTALPSGMLIPSMLMGASSGRAIGTFLMYLKPKPNYPGKYALIGAAAMLSGVVRMAMTVTVIFIEISNSTSLGMPIMVAVMTAKYVGNIFNEGLYEISIEIKGIPYLKWEAPPLSHRIKTSSVMSYPVVTLRPIETVGKIMHVLKTTSHNGFPVSDKAKVCEHKDGKPSPDLNMEPCSFFRGMILRSQLIILVKNKQFMETSHLGTQKKLDIYSFSLPTGVKDLNSIELSKTELDYTVDLRPILNPATYTVQQNMSLEKMFNLFKILGLRHIVVTDLKNGVFGIVTRKDLARYRTCACCGAIEVIEVPFY